MSVTSAKARECREHSALIRHALSRTGIGEWL